MLTLLMKWKNSILKNSVIGIFDMFTKVNHKIIKMNYDRSLKEIWDIMIEDRLKMAALESESNNSFIQGYTTYSDFLEFFLKGYEDEIADFEIPIKSLTFYYAQRRTSDDNDETIKVASKDEKLLKVLKKMLDYRIGMIWIVDDLESKKTIGLFFLKDIFWILRSARFEFLDKTVLELLRTIYNDTLELNSGASEGEFDNQSEGESYTDSNSDEEMKFMQELDEDETSPVHNKNLASKSFYDDDQNHINLNRKDEISESDKHLSQTNILQDNLENNKNLTISDPQMTKMSSFVSENPVDFKNIGGVNSSSSIQKMR